MVLRLPAYRRTTIADWVAENSITRRSSPTRQLQSVTVHDHCRIHVHENQADRWEFQVLPQAFHHVPQ